MRAVLDFFRPCFDGICDFCIIFADKILCMEQIERIKTMEQHLDRASQAVIRLSAALDDYAEAQEAIRQLSAYYDSDEWKRDFSDDEQGLLPRDLKRGVLSEDAIWNLLEDSRALNARMQEVLNVEKE